MHNYKLTIAYDGTHYAGWQIQANDRSIQQTLQEAISIILRHPVILIGSGRTDAGVHAKGQVAHFKTELSLDSYRFLNSLNGILPKDIRVKNMALVPSDFHAQYSAIGKVYYYHLFLERIMDPFLRLYCWQIHERIDLELLQQAAEKFKGTHDFTSFANEAHSGSASRDPIRTLRRLDIVKEESGVRLEFEADGFLYKMVRNILGTMTEVASYKRPLEDIEVIFEARSRQRAGQAAPPQGLFLMHVEYTHSSSKSINFFKQS